MHIPYEVRKKFRKTDGSADKRKLRARAERINGELISATQFAREKVQELQEAVGSGDITALEGVKCTLRLAQMVEFNRRRVQAAFRKVRQGGRR